MVKKSLRYTNRRPSSRPPEAIKPDRRRYLLLAVPPLIGGLAAYVEHNSTKAKVGELQTQIAREEYRYRIEYVRQRQAVGESMANDPQVQELARNLRDGGEVTLGQLMGIGLKTLEQNPGYIENVYSQAIRNALVTQAHEMQIEHLEQNATQRMLREFGIWTSIPYAILGLAYLHGAIKRKLARFRAGRKRKAKESASSIEVPEPEAVPESMAPVAEPEAMGPSAVPAEPQAAKAIEETVPSSPPPSGKRRKKKCNGGPKEKARSGIILSEESRAQLAERGFDPDTIQKALIRSFKILSKNKILLGEKSAPSSGLCRDLSRLVGDEYRASLVLALLDDEGLLLRHKGDRISLNPEPDGTLGKLMARDIRTNLERM